MPKSILDLLCDVEPETERLVRETRHRLNQSVRRLLREETRLHLSSVCELSDERDLRAVRVNVTLDIPDGLEHLSIDDDLALSISLAPMMRLFEDTQRGLASLVPSIDRLSQRDDFRARFADAPGALSSALKAVGDLALEARRADLLGKIFSVNRDVLGVYRYQVPQAGWEEASPHAQVDLYWQVIGLTSRLLGVSVEGLTVTVLAHELAHAYTHLGADADGRRWRTRAFHGADIALQEALAQYYTHRVLVRLGRQALDAEDAYQRLLPRQSEIYRGHLAWVERHTPEDVRAAMRAIRLQDFATMREFEWLLSRAKA